MNIINRLILLVALIPYVAYADSWRVDRRVVTDGDSEYGVIERAGEPDEIVTLVNKFGVPVGKRLIYKVKKYGVNKTVSVEIYDGEVSRIKHDYH